MEELANNSFAPAAEDILSHAPAARTAAPPFLAARAQVLALTGRFDQAKTEYEQLAARVPEGSSLAVSIQLKQGAIAYRQQRFEDALRIFETLRDRNVVSFELFYNLALTELSVLNTAEHRNYYTKAQEEDAARLALLESDGAAASAVFAGIPRGEIAPLLFSPEVLQDPLRTAEDSRKEQLLSSSMLVGASPKILLLLGILVVVGGAFLHTTGEHVRERPLSRGFRLWNFLPGGFYFAGTEPGYGLGLLGIFLAWLIAAAEVPMRTFPVFPGERGLHFLFAGAACLTCILSALPMLLAGRRAHGE
jgi:tetratricopeptide (TPR) repeat protein